jgi:uncharacterized membrane protein SirB2
MSWLCPAFWWWERNIYLVFSVFTSRLNFLLASVKVSVFFFTCIHVLENINKDTYSVKWFKMINHVNMELCLASDHHLMMEMDTVSKTLDTTPYLHSWLPEKASVAVKASDYVMKHIAY